MYEAEARRWMQSVLPGVDISAVSDEAIHDYLCKAHPDGWGGFCYAIEQREHAKSGHFGRDIVRDNLPDTPLRQWARISARFNLRKGILDEVMMLREEDHEIVLAMKVHETVETGRRIKITRQGIRIRCWKRTDDGWWREQSPLESWFDRPEYDESHLWGRIRDMERVASDEWQLSECYRPGTAKTPMDGAIRRDEMSHSDVFGKVTRPTNA
jgi:hypothetical protein